MEDRDRWEAQVRAVDWKSVPGYSNGGTPLEPLMLRLWEPADVNTKAGVYREIRGLVVHQGTTYETSAVVARLLIALVAQDHAPHKDLACNLLTAIAVGDEDATLTQLSVEEQKRQFARQLDIQARPDTMSAEDRLWEPWKIEGVRAIVAASNAVRAGVPTYLRLLTSDDPRTRLRASALLGWFSEDKRQTIPPLISMVEAETNPWVRATAAIALAMLSQPDDLEVQRVLQAVRHSESQAEQWSGCIALAMTLPAPPDDIVEQLFAIRWEAWGKTYPWGFYDGIISDFAGSVIDALPRSTAAAQVRALLPRLQSPEPSDQDNVIALLLWAAIGKDDTLDTLDFPRLPGFQATALHAIAEAFAQRESLRTRNKYLLLRQYGIPVPDIDAFIAWATAGMRARGKH
jgi:HEAT repeat protein